MQVSEREILNLLEIRYVRSVGLLLCNNASGVCVNKNVFKDLFQLLGWKLSRVG
jgi:hypothetical protein